MKALGDAASELPWLVPDAAALVNMTRSPAVADWKLIRRDPGAVLLIARSEPTATLRLAFAPPCGRPSPNQESPFAASLARALELLQTNTAPFIDWNARGPCYVYRKSLEIAQLSQTIAQTIGRCDADQAWSAGLLAPLGWMAICAVDPNRVADDLQAFARHGYCASWQCEFWGLDHAAITRRLSRRWQLPDWLGSVVSYLGLPSEVASRLGAEPLFFQVVQLAVSLCQRHEPGLALPVGTRLVDLLNSLDLSGIEIDRILRTSRSQAQPLPAVWQPPSREPLLPDLLSLAIKLGRSRRQPQVEEPSRTGFLARPSDLLSQKMVAMAELAAGAGHEINNPLAVISGQAQYIGRQLREAQELIPEEPGLADYLETLQAGIGRSLKTIVSQSQRIHHVLIDLMQFARPAPARPSLVHVRELVQDAGTAIEDVANARKVHVECPDVPDTWRLQVDPVQTRTALTCLLRNAVDAAPPDGLVVLRAEASGENTLRLIVEDNGPGPLAAVEEHMFDPFYSGRSAGRGRGLGLSIAWRLAHEQGGSVSFDGHVDGVTRFVLSLPGLACSYAAPETDGHASDRRARGVSPLMERSGV